MKQTIKEYQDSVDEVNKLNNELNELNDLISENGKTEDEINKLKENIDKKEKSLNNSKSIMEMNSKIIEIEENNFNRIKEDVEKYGNTDFGDIQAERQKDIDRSQYNSELQNSITENIDKALQDLKNESEKFETKTAEFFGENMEKNLTNILNLFTEAEIKFGELQLPEFKSEVINESSEEEEEQKDQGENYASKAQEARLLI